MGNTEGKFHHSYHCEEQDDGSAKTNSELKARHKLYSITCCYNIMGLQVILIGNIFIQFGIIYFDPYHDKIIRVSHYEQYWKIKSEFLYDRYKRNNQER